MSRACSAVSCGPSRACREAVSRVSESVVAMAPVEGPGHRPARPTVFGGTVTKVIHPPAERLLRLLRLLSPPGVISIQDFELFEVRHGMGAWGGVEGHHPGARGGEGGPLGQAGTVRVAGPGEV